MYSLLESLLSEGVGVGLGTGRVGGGGRLFALHLAYPRTGRPFAQMVRPGRSVTSAAAFASVFGHGCGAGGGGRGAGHMGGGGAYWLRAWSNLSSPDDSAMPLLMTKVRTDICSKKGLTT